MNKKECGRESSVLTGSQSIKADKTKNPLSQEKDEKAIHEV
jgi:hypothetical protein